MAFANCFNPNIVSICPIIASTDKRGTDHRLREIVIFAKLYSQLYEFYSFFCECLRFQEGCIHERTA